MEIQYAPSRPSRRSRYSLAHANHRGAGFCAEDDYRRYLGTLQDPVAKHRRAIHACALMTTPVRANGNDVLGGERRERKECGTDCKAGRLWSVPINLLPWYGKEACYPPVAKRLWVCSRVEHAVAAVNIVTQVNFFPFTGWKISAMVFSCHTVSEGTRGVGREKEGTTNKNGAGGTIAIAVGG
jgi:hypothetical protein